MKPLAQRPLGTGYPPAGSLYGDRVQAREGQPGASAALRSGKRGIENRLQPALHGGWLISAQELGDGHASYETEIWLAGRQCVQPDVFLHDKFLLILRVLLQGPLIAFIALIGAASEDQGLHGVLRCRYDRAASYGNWNKWNKIIPRVLVASRLK